MSGLLALLDDVAAIAKMAAASVDDIAGQAAQAGAKAAGVVIDDAAVTPKYVAGLAPARELPIIGKIAFGSAKNKILILLPLALLLASFAPWLITPLLMLGGLYLCFEGAEKVFHWLFPHGDAHVEKDMSTGDPAHLEEQRVAGAIKTDFILSAEIMALTLASIDASNIWIQAAVLAIVGLGITAVVYGAVALIVKMDDIGLFMVRNGRLSLTRKVGRGLLLGMPVFMQVLTVVGTAAMIWVGGSILIHGLADLGWHAIYDWIHHQAEALAHAVPSISGFVKWATTALLDGVIGLAVGLMLIPVATRIIGPAIAGMKRKA